MSLISGADLENDRGFHGVAETPVVVSVAGLARSVGGDAE